MSSSPDFKPSPKQEQYESCPVCFSPLDGLPDFCHHCGTDLTTLTRSASPTAKQRNFFVEFTPGNVVLGRYSILEVIGRGGMGVIYKAIDTLKNREVAIKTVNLDVAGYGEEEDLAELRKRFTRETYASLQVDHPNVVKVYDVGSVDDEAYIAMEFLKGHTLDEILYLDGALPLRKFIKIAVPLTDAIHHIHKSGIIHRDIKPSNVMVDKDDIPKVMDFGLAKVQIAGVSGFTREDQIMGTAQYCSPEVIQGDTVDHRSDVFALGIVFYELITGVNPFQAASVGAILDRTLNEVPEPPSAIMKGVPEWLDTAILTCLNKDPEQRFASAAELREVLKSSGEALRPEFKENKVASFQTDAPEDPHLDKPTSSKEMLDDNDSFFNRHKHDLAPIEQADEDDPEVLEVTLAAEIGSLLKKAEFARREEDYNRANAFYAQVVKLDLSRHEGWLGKCLVLLEQEKDEGFVNAWETAMSLFPHDSELLLLRALHLWRNNEKSKLVTFLNLNRIAPKDTALYWLIKAELVAEHLEKASACIKRVLAIENSWYTNFQIGKIFAKAQWFDYSTTYLQRSINMERSRQVTYVWLGLVREAMADYEAARQCYLAAIDLNSRNKEAREGLSRVEKTNMTSRLVGKAKYFLSRKLNLRTKID